MPNSPHLGNSRTIANGSPTATAMSPGKTAATMDVIKTGAHMPKNRAMYSLSNAASIKKADKTHPNVDPVVADEMDRENLRLLENANVLVLSKFNEWRYVN